MNIVDTISRGRRALIGWVTITVLLLGLFMLIRTNASGNVTDDIDDAQRRGVAHAAVIAGAVEARPDSDAVRFTRRSLATIVQAEVFDDPTVARVRLYSLDGLLLFASDQDVRPGDVQVQSEDPGVAAAAAGDPYRSVVTNDFTWSTIGGPTTSTELLQTFLPLRDVNRIGPAGVVQVDFFMDDLRAAALSSADRMLSVIAVLALLSLAAAVWTLRRPTAAASATEDAADTDADVDATDTAASPASPKVPARNPAKEAEAASLRKTLETAERHRAEADERVRAVQSEITAVKAKAEVAGQRIRTLETELEAARGRQAELEEGARAAGASEEAAAQKTSAETEELRRRLADTESRATSAEEALASEKAEASAARKEVDELREAATKSVQDAAAAQETSAETEELRRRLADTESRAQETEELRRRLADTGSRAQAAEEAVASAQAQAMAARKEADELRRAATTSVQDAPPVARDSSAGTDADALRRLEERIAAAEARAREAEEKIDDLASEISPEANDLRARLARTAARKRLGPSSGTEG